MKKIIHVSLLLFIGNHFLMSQNTHGTTTKNYVYEKTCLDEGCVKKIENIQYLDGLNRPKQIINIKATPQGNDVVTPFEYDGYGVQTKSYLPIPQTSTGNGSFNTNPTSNGTGFYGTSNFYSELVHDGSFLTKVSEKSNPGDEWALSSGNTLKSITDINKSSDNVRKYMITVSWDDATKVVLSTISKINLYNEGELYKTVLTNEDNNRTITFKNKLGKVILIRKENNNAGNIENIDTYYVYNFYNQLVYVIPPLAAVKTVIDQSTLDNLCYQYRYDVNGRMVEKKLPGKGFDATSGIWQWDSFVYDKADRVILTQDANLQKQGKWMITKSDKFGRVIYTGVILGGTRNNMQNQAVNLSIIESEDATGFTKNGMQVYYTNNYFTNLETVLSVNYYDTYPQGTPTIPLTILNQEVLTQNASNLSISTKSLPTATYVKNIEDDNWTKAYSWYDTKGRVIGSHSINYLGGYTKTEIKLDFVGAPITTATKHKKLASDNETVILEDFIYDDQKRLTQHWHQVNGNPKELLTENTYDAVSQLINKKVGNNLQSIDYAYNIRGWMAKINDPLALGSKLFGLDIKSNNPSSLGTAKYNGNISEVNWKTSSDGILKRYSYEYDALDRLLNAVYSESDMTLPPTNYFNESLTYDINGNIKTLKRFSKPSSGTTAEKIDDLNYIYQDNNFSNKLNQITSNGTNNSSGYNALGKIFVYDSNGNMTSHGDKGINTINYNFLNLPNEVLTSTSYYIQPFKVYYTYKADGTKVQQKYIVRKSDLAGGFEMVETKTDYLDGFQYSPDTPCSFCSVGEPVLQFIPTSEGYFDFSNNRYVYNYTDQVGNVRVSFTKGTNGTPEVLEDNNYYPFGLKHKGAQKISSTKNYKYSFQGLEQQDGTNWYSCEWRNYDPSIGRFFNIDPMAELQPDMTPFRFGFNNPISVKDPTGMYEEGGGMGGDYYDDSDRGNDFAGVFDINFHWSGESQSYGESSNLWDILRGAWGIDVDIRSGTHDANSSYGDFMQDLRNENFLDAGEKDGPGRGTRDIWGDGGNVVYNGKAWFNSNYIGPGPDGNPNPYDLLKGGLKPLDIIDKAAFDHDVGYYYANATGAKDAVVKKALLGADMKLAADAKKAIDGYRKGAIDTVTGEKISQRTYNMARLVYGAFSSIKREKSMRTSVYTNINHFYNTILNQISNNIR